MAERALTAVFSDIHGNLPALEACVADAQARGCTQFLNLGDIVSGPLWPAETATYLMARDWPTIAGNHERQLLTHKRPARSDRYAKEQMSAAQRGWLAALPATLDLGDVLLCHGTPDDDMAPLLERYGPTGSRPATDKEMAARLGDRAHRLTLCGHTHRPGSCTLADGRMVANPGSVGLQGFLVQERDVLIRLEMGSPHARYATIGADLIVTHHQVAYDHRAAVAKARAEGREDWAVPLATGFVTPPDEAPRVP